MATGTPVATLSLRRLEAPLRLLAWGTVLVPLIFLSGFFFPFVTTRALFFRALVEIALGAICFAALLSDRRIRISRDPFFISLAVFVGVSAVSAALSGAPTRSFYGNFERMGGVWAWLHWLVYYAVLRIVLDERSWTIFFRIGAAVSAIVSAVGTYQFIEARIHASSLPTGPIVSTIGNSGLMAGYLIFGLILSAILIQGDVRYKALWIGVFALDLMVIWLSHNRSSVVGILLGAIAGVVCYALTAGFHESRRILTAAAAALLLAVIVVWIGTMRPEGFLGREMPETIGRLVRSDLNSVDLARRLQWTTATRGFLDHPIIGVGPENHLLVWSHYFDPRALHSEALGVFDRPHNEFLEALETTGVIGFLAFVSVWIFGSRAVFVGWTRGRISAAELSIFVGAQITYAAYLFFWFTDVNATPLWIATNAFFIGRATDDPLLTVIPVERPRALARPILAVVILIAAASLYLHVWAPLRVAQLLDLVQNPRLPLRTALAAAHETFDSPGSQKSSAVLIFGGYFASISPNFEAIRRDPERSALLDSALWKTLVGSEREVRRDPRDDRLKVEYARVLIVAGEYYRDPKYLRAAIAQVNDALALSPNRMHTRVILANIYSSLGEYPAAIAAIRSAIRIDPSLGSTHYELARVLTDAGQFDSAVAEFGRSFALGYIGDGQAYVKAAEAFVSSGRIDVAAIIYAKYLQSAYGTRVWEGVEQPVRSPSDVWIAARLPILFVDLRDPARARRSANALLALNPSDSEIVAGFHDALPTLLDFPARRPITLKGCPPGGVAGSRTPAFTGCRSDSAGISNR